MVCSAPHRRCCASGSFFSFPTAAANVSRRSLSRPASGSSPNHFASGFWPFKFIYVQRGFGAFGWYAIFWNPVN